MSKINIEILKGQKKELYKHLWEDKVLEFSVVEKGEKDPSYEFEFGKSDLITFVGSSLSENFKIKEKELFLKKFKMACSGSGDELQKITTMHSSSLCSLLFFFSVSKEKPLKITLGDEEYNFTESYFEFKNKVIGYPSNVDVVLLGASAKKKAILFLESKFSEFITSVTKEESKFKIGKSYFKKGSPSEPIYKELFAKNILKHGKGDHVSAEEDKYIEGIKQMISHYYGVRNFIDEKYYNEDDVNQKDVIKYYKENKDCEILLGTILFDNLPEDQKTKYLSPYKEDYKKLAKIINNQYSKETQENKPSIVMLDKPLTYSEFKESISDMPIVQQFYFGERR